MQLNAEARPPASVVNLNQHCDSHSVEHMVLLIVHPIEDLVAKFCLATYNTF